MLPSGKLKACPDARKPKACSTTRWRCQNAPLQDRVSVARLPPLAETDRLAGMRIIKPALGACVLLALSCACAQTNISYQRTEDVIYGRSYGTALTLDVFQPPKPNGLGIIALVSGGWLSCASAINPDNFRPLLARGYTVFAVVHGSQPRYIVTVIEPDIHRAVRFIRHDAAKYGVDPNRLGLTGGSAGGHLSLTMATQGCAGDPKAKDLVERESSEVQCVACFFPPTDFLNYGQPGEDAVGVGVLKAFKPAFGPLADTAEGRQKLGHEIRPSTSSIPTCRPSSSSMATPTTSCPFTNPAPSSSAAKRSAPP